MSLAEYRVNAEVPRQERAYLAVETKENENIWNVFSNQENEEMGLDMQWKAIKEFQAHRGMALYAF